MQRGRKGRCVGLTGFLIVVVGIAAAACNGAPAEPVRPEIVPDFFGEVQSVVQGEGWSFGPTSVSEGEPPYPTATQVGPATISLSSGRELMVPAGTPGSMGCMKFITQADAIKLEGGIYVTLDEFRRMERESDFPDRCAVLGELDDAGDVAWFELFRIEGARIVVGQLERVDNGIAYTTEGFGFRVAENVEVSCPDSPEAPTGLEEALDAWGSLHYAQVDVTTGEVVHIQCVTQVEA